MEMSDTIFFSPRCPHCKDLLAIVKNQQVPCRLVNVDVTPARVEFVPVMITSNGKMMSGRELFDWARAGGRKQQSVQPWTGGSNYAYFNSDEFCEHHPTYSYI